MGRISQNESIVLFGLKFYKQTSGYWICRKYLKIEKKYKSFLAHRWVWENHYGRIPKNYEIHHIDKNKSNNNIENLKIVTRSEHQKIHAQEPESIDRLKKVSPIKWLKSDAGKQVISEIGKKIWFERQPKEITCQNCGEKAFYKRWAKFCSKKCYMKWVLVNKINFIDSRCQMCDKIFKKQRSKKTKCCSHPCAMKLKSIKYT